jgi:hypothetical protein
MLLLDCFPSSSFATLTDHLTELARSTTASSFARAVGYRTAKITNTDPYVPVKAPVARG